MATKKDMEHKMYSIAQNLTHLLGRYSFVEENRFDAKSNEHIRSRGSWIIPRLCRKNLPVLCQDDGVDIEKFWMCCVLYTDILNKGYWSKVYWWSHSFSTRNNALFTLFVNKLPILWCYLNFLVLDLILLSTLAVWS